MDTGNRLSSTYEIEPAGDTRALHLCARLSHFCYQMFFSFLTHKNYIQGTLQINMLKIWYKMKVLQELTIMLPKTKNKNKTERKKKANVQSFALPKKVNR